MARRGGAASRAPSLLPPFACAPAAPLACSARALAASGPESARAGGRVSLERWPSGAPGSPAKQSASRWRQRRRRLPAARPAPGPLGDLLSSLASRSSSLSSLLGPLGVSPPSNLLNKVTGRTNQMAGFCQAKLTEIGNVRCKCNLPSPPADQAPTPHLCPLPDAQEPRKGAGGFRPVRGGGDEDWKEKSIRRAGDWCAHPQPRATPTSTLAQVFLPPSLPRPSVSPGSAPPVRACGCLSSRSWVCSAGGCAPHSPAPELE